MKLEDVKLYLRIDGDEEDALIQNILLISVNAKIKF